MKALITTRELLVKQKTAATNSLKALNRKAVKSVVAIKVLKSNIKMFTRRIKALEKEMDNLIDKKPAIKQTVNILRSTPGVQSLMAGICWLLPMVLLLKSIINSYLHI